jgi:hypothetical protein
VVVNLLDAPLDFIDRVRMRRARAVGADDPAARLVVRASARLRPTPRFRKQLRTNVLNRYVAVREGLVAAPVRRREMGALGRSVLYATFALAVGVTSVGAASTSALPGDALYAVKLQIESVRMQIAPPVARHMLAELALNTRLSELEQLARAGRWDQVPAAAESVAAATGTLEALGGPSDGEAASLALHTEILTALLGTAPDAAKTGIQTAITASTSPGPAVAPSQTGQSGQATGSGGGASDGSSSASPHVSTPAPSRSPQPVKSPKDAPSKR